MILDIFTVPEFERLTCFYLTISEIFEVFQYFNLEIDFLKNENFFQKTGPTFFS